MSISDVNLVDYNQVPENSAETVRKSIDETQFVIKWDETPTFITDGSIIPISILTYEECLDLMSTENWYEPE